MKPVEPPIHAKTFEAVLWRFAEVYLPSGNGHLMTDHRVESEGPDGTEVLLTWWLDFSWNIEAGGGSSEPVRARLLVRHEPAGKGLPDRFAIVASQFL